VPSGGTYRASVCKISLLSRFRIKSKAIPASQPAKDFVFGTVKLFLSVDDAVNPLLIRACSQLMIDIKSLSSPHTFCQPDSYIMIPWTDRIMQEQMFDKCLQDAYMHRDLELVSKLLARGLGSCSYIEHMRCGHNPGTRQACVNTFKFVVPPP
jgi:hypothetical protein